LASFWAILGKYRFLQFRIFPAIYKCFLRTSRYETLPDNAVLDTTWEQYLFGLNFAGIVSTGVGYGDCTPNNVVEMVTPL
jgi:hypothetical protein